MSSNEKTPLLHKETKVGESNGEISIENNDESSNKTERRSLLKVNTIKILLLLLVKNGVLFKQNPSH